MYIRTTADVNIRALSSPTIQTSGFQGEALPQHTRCLKKVSAAAPALGRAQLSPLANAPYSSASQAREQAAQSLSPKGASLGPSGL